jgi:hypothetical protein
MGSLSIFTYFSLTSFRLNTGLFGRRATKKAQPRKIVPLT